MLPHIETLTALMRRLIPADETGPDGVDCGVLDYLRRHWDGDLAPQQAFIVGGLAALEHVDFAALEPGRQDVFITEIEQGRGPGAASREWLLKLCELSAEGYYGDPENGGNTDAVSWRLIGYRPEPKVPYDPEAHARISPAALADLQDDYDVIVVGAGAGGGILACVLSEAGHRVLLLERGRWLPHHAERRDHLRNHRLALYGHNTGPDLDGNPRVYADHWGEEHVVRPNQGFYHNNAMTVGGGTRVYGAQAWRFLPEDFLMASIYGVPDGSSLADWPITYETLAPYYDRAEWEIGVSGSPHARRGDRARPYPMPPVPDTPKRRLLREAANRLGWNTAPVPLLINSQPYGGRQACVKCGMCVGFTCPSDAKNGSHNTVIPRALAAGCTLITRAQVDRILTDAAGTVTGVHAWVDDPAAGQPVERRIRARIVVCSAGAIETARLLLHSPSSRDPRGLGNNHDQVGRHLQGHTYVGAHGYFERPLEDCEGPGPVIATCDFNHGNPGIIGGGMLANEFTKLPIIAWRGSMPPGMPLWGVANKDFMRLHYRSLVQICGPVQDIPAPTCRVTLHPDVRDRIGMPVPRLSGIMHPETRRTAEYMRERATEWMKAAYPDSDWSYPTGIAMSGGQHQAGTCRMSLSPHQGVCDPMGRVHGHRNLFVADGSLHVTNGGFNPVLTIMALAFKVADHVLDSL